MPGKTMSAERRGRPAHLRLQLLKSLASKKLGPDLSSRGAWDAAFPFDEVSLDSPCNHLLGHTRELEQGLKEKHGVPLTVIAEPGRTCQELREAGCPGLRRERR